MTDNFQGRIGRDRFWRLTGLCGLAFCVAFFSIALTINHSNIAALVLVVFAVFLFFATCVALLGAGVRRLHDRGKSGFWIILYYVVPAVLVVASMDPNGQRDALFYIALAILAWAVIDLGVREGKPVEEVAA
ncbi:hypothetical protein BH11PSE4_BH11PSE4_06600 [soil metagenome]